MGCVPGRYSSSVWFFWAQFKAFVRWYFVWPRCSCRSSSAPAVASATTAVDDERSVCVRLQLSYRISTRSASAFGDAASVLNLFIFMMTSQSSS
ncbi:hypothetical protein SETIT_6G131600v2 [Setaria italica]|uniref:Uncharacterized protein n=1 Tax=Setaria italica TaxID=4555 RepID=K3YP02_SETIT|nr:hypothetical protein SETIT_6G131600v2 [Setaria italica]